MKKQPEVSFRADESIAAGVVRIADVLIGYATDRIARRQDDRTRDVHAIRVSIKRLRALLRLIRPAIGEAAFERENAALRTCGRRLAFSRDMTIVQQTLSALAESLRNKGDRQVVRQALSHSEMRLDPRLEIEQAMQDVARTLQRAAGRIKRMKLAGSEWQTVGKGLRVVYAQARKRMQIAFTKRSDKAYHEWRIRVKNLYHQLQMLDPMWPKRLKRLAARLKTLQAGIGADHDLVVVKSLLLDQPDAFGGDEAVRRLAGLLEAKSRQLRSKSRPLGKALFREEPGAFIRKLGRHWRAWRA